MDTKGRAIEPGRQYVVQLNSQAKRMTSMRDEAGRVMLMDADRKLHDVDLLMEGGFQICRYCDWIQQQGRAALHDTLIDIQERSLVARKSLMDLEHQCRQVLFAGDDSDSLDHILGFVWDGRGTVEELIALVPVHEAGAHAS